MNDTAPPPSGMKPWPSDPRFLVSPDGVVIGLSGRPLKPRINQSGYARISVSNGARKCRDFYIHRIVLETFVGPCPEGCEADHKNGKRSDNSINNLRWLLRRLNLARRKVNSGEEHPNAKLSSSEVTQIRDAIGSQSQIAARFGISREHVRDIRSGKARANEL